MARSLHGTRIRRAIWIGALIGSTGLVPVDAAAFALLGDPVGPVETVLQEAARWSAEPDPFGGGTGLHDGIQVAVSPTFATDIGAVETAALYGLDVGFVVAEVEGAIQGAFRAWENDALRFDLSFGGPAAFGPGSGFELDLLADFLAPDGVFGFANAAVASAEDRLLTNGQRFDGGVIVGADVVINATRIRDGAVILQGLGLPFDQVVNALQILITHEVGHAIGLGHPNDETFYDTDDDPRNPLPIDPLDPFANLQVAANPTGLSPLDLPVMWGGISSGDIGDLIQLFGRLANPGLVADDVGGRDVLYPVPEPGTGLLLGLAAGILLARGRPAADC